MAASGSYARGDQPRSVPDPDAQAYREMVRKQKAINARQGRGNDSSRPGRVEHPGALESMIPVWGSGKEAIADFHDGDYLGAAGNGLLAVTDVVPAKAFVGALAKGALVKGAPYVWRTKPWEKGQGGRQWLGERGVVKPGQPVHHWVIGMEQKSPVPDFIKNQPIFLKPMKDAVQHGRVHGGYTVNGVTLPRYGVPARIWYGSPDWAKAAPVSVGGRLVPDDNRKERSR